MSDGGYLHPEEPAQTAESILAGFIFGACQLGATFGGQPHPGYAVQTARVALRDLAEHGFTVTGAGESQPSPGISSEHLEYYGIGPLRMTPEREAVIRLFAEGPHSRACGVRRHEHGPDCHPNCPTCGGTGTVCDV